MEIKNEECIKIAKEILINYLNKKIKYANECNKKFTTLTKSIDKFIATEDIILKKQELLSKLEEQTEMLLEYVHIGSVRLLENILNVIESEKYIFSSDMYLQIFEFSLEEIQDIYGVFESYIYLINSANQEKINSLELNSILDTKRSLLDLIKSNEIFLNTISCRIDANIEASKKIKTKNKLYENEELYNLEVLCLEENDDYYKVIKVHSKIDKINKLYKLLENTTEIEIKQKHIEIFDNMPFVSDSAKEMFLDYVNVINENIKYKEQNKKVGNFVKLAENIVNIKPKKKHVNLVKYDNLEEQEPEISSKSKKIIDAILVGNDLEHIDAMLPKKENNNYYSFKAEIIFLLEKEIEKTNILITSSENTELLLYKKSLLKTCKEIKIYFENQEETENNIHMENILENKINEKKIFFALKSNDNAYVLDDIDSLCEEDKIKAIQLLKMIKGEAEIINTNDTKKLTHYSNTTSVFEVRYENARLFYENIIGNSYLLLGIFIKKTNVDPVIVKAVQNRMKKTKLQYKNLIKEIKENNKIEEHNDIYDECMKQIEKKIKNRL